MEKVQIRDPAWKKFESGINIPDPQHWQRLKHNLSNWDATVQLLYSIFVQKFIKFAKPTHPTGSQNSGI
jgi:hypothetical protein